MVEEYVDDSPDAIARRKDLLDKPTFVSQIGIKTAHLACFIGDYEILEILKDYYDANFDERTSKGLTCLHCSVQRKEGVVSIYFLKQN